LEHWLKFCARKI